MIHLTLFIYETNIEILGYKTMYLEVEPNIENC